MNHSHRIKSADTPLQVPTYYETYVGKVPNDIDLIKQLADSQNKLTTLLNSLSEEEWSYRYAEGKWSAKEAMIHLIDSERIFAIRILRIARGDQTPQPGFDQNDYVPFSEADDRYPESILEEYFAVRNSTISLLENLPLPAWSYTGTASDNPFSVKGIAFIIAGHELHHLKIFREQYFPNK